ncbi:hypothetical protein CVT25_002194 [Psilocybe cyanescens]|uniref:ARID domain-containing protein n=1 Tax=Psilocybe cyanescens TaxID=93625 RepID=A0A409XF33_PSICY|nr:hypothetical protein CVT25_002194 [Psilocybe cyanescens]
MVPQNASQQGRSQQSNQQIGFQSFGQSPASNMDSASFILDSPQVAKQMAALNAASQARIAQNTRIAPSFLPPSAGTSSGPYLGGINSHSYTADLSANRHANFQMPNNQTPNSATGASFLESSMSHPDPLRNPTNAVKTRQHAFLQGIASIMSKRNTPLPPSLTGVQVPNYDPTNSPYSIIEPSAEVGSFRLAGKDVDLWKLWGLVFQNGGGNAVTSANLWPKFLSAFDLPEHFPEMQANNSTLVAVMLSQYYMAILHPFEEYYRTNLNEQAKKVLPGQRPGPMPNKQFPPSSGLGRPVTGMTNMQQSGIRSNNANGLMGQTIPPSNGMAQYPQMHPQNRPTSSQNPHQISAPESSISLGSSEIDPLVPSIDSNLLDQDIQGIKRKHDQEDRDMKRVRQKTDPPEGNTALMSMTPDQVNNLQGRQASQPPSNLNASLGPRQQPSRRKIEYVPLAREVQSYGGRDLYNFDAEWNNIISRRNIREINDWGIVDIECLCMSIRSRLSIELSYALTTLAVLSTMRGNTPGSGFPLYQCPDLLDDTLDLLEELAFGEAEKDSFSEMADTQIATNRELVALVQDTQSRPFASLEKHQSSQDANVGLQQRPGDIIITIIGIIRNMSNLTNNAPFIAKFPRLLDMVLRVCMVFGEPPSPASKNLSLSDLITIRKDTMTIFTNVSIHVNLSNNTSPVTLRIARRAFKLFASYLVDPNDSVPPLASVQVAGLPPNPNRRPSILADTALDVFAQFSQPDSNRQILGKAIPLSDLWVLLTSLVHRLPIIDADFLLMQRSEPWMSFIEKNVMAIYSVVFLSPYELRQKIKSDRALGFKNVMLRLAQQVLSFPTDGRTPFISSPRRAIETMKLLDKSEELADTSEPTMPALTFGMGFSEGNDAGMEKGTGILGANRDMAWEMLMTRDVLSDDVFFSELEKPQILIIPTADAVNFQKGFLGAEGEHAAIEGELQLKGVDTDHWGRVTISLRSFESAYQNEIELSTTEIELYSKLASPHLSFPSSIPFAIPLSPDTPQSIQTPHSFLGHTLTASLHPLDGRSSILTKGLTVHTRRYSSHSSALYSSPEEHVLEDPTRVEVQLPRDTFTSGEAIPLYVTVPPPTRETVVDKGLRLRNVRAELVRVVKVKREHFNEDDPDPDTETTMEDLDQQQGSSSFLNSGDAREQHQPLASSSKTSLSPLFLGSSYRVVIARSGASCRFHSSRPIQLRFVLHQNSSVTPSDSQTNLGRMDSDTECPLVTQTTLLHSVLFHIKVHVSFVDTSNQTERISTLQIPVTILAPPAPLPEVSQSLDEAYQKKHDRPPARTVREEESDPSIPHYSEGEAGPSMHSSGAPPPFEERDAPPPFFVSSFESSSSSRLPTFQESESEIILPDSNATLSDVPLLRTIPGEGTIFGFSSDQQFDGHTDDMQRSSTPPPTLEMASRDTDLTALTDQPGHVAIEALGIVLDQIEETVHAEENPPPPPPPAMDDPSDPPPSIDSEFRSPGVVHQTSPSRASSPLNTSYHQGDPPLRLQASTPTLPPRETQASHGHAPPPYLNAESHRVGENDQVMRPPPYAD